MAASSDESLEEVDKVGSLGQKGMKTVGRQVGTPHKPYTWSEITTAFNFLVSICPSNVQGGDFLKQLQNEIKRETGTERTLSALQTFVKGKLREEVPEMYNRRFVKGKEEISRNQLFFLKEYMKNTKWKPTTKKSTVSNEVPEGGMKKLNDDHKEKKVMVQKKIFNSTEYSALKVNVMQDLPSLPSKSAVTFAPQVASTPRRRPQEGKAGTSSQGDTFDLDEIKRYLDRTMANYFHNFKAEAMREVRNMCSAEHCKRTHESEQEKNSPKRSRLQLSEVIELGDTTDEETEEEGRYTKEQEVKKEVDAYDHQSEEECNNNARDKRKQMNEEEEYEGERVSCVDTTEERQQTNEEQIQTENEMIIQGMPEGRQKEQVMNNVTPMEKEKGNEENDVDQGVAEDTPTGPENFDNQESSDKDEAQNKKGKKTHLDDAMTVPQVLVSEASDSEVKERAQSFLLSPLRARLATLTVVEIYKVTGEEDEPKERSQFHVLEKGDGDLTIVHGSALDDENWSVNATVNHKNITLDDELDSVNKLDIVEACKNEVVNLSPMSVTDISKHKRTFRSAVLKSKGRVVKALLKRMDDASVSSSLK